MFDLKPFIADPDEKPLDRLCPDGGYTALFRSIACIGDSLSSGEFESMDVDKKRGYHDYFDYSWGQFIARMAGTKVLNFSRGGMTAEEYWKSFAESKGFWSEDLLCQCYIIALGVNDVINKKQPMGTVADADSNEEVDTFCYYYCQIIRRLKQMQPKARFFLVSMPKTTNEDSNRIKEAHNRLLHELAEHFDYTYVIDLFTHSPTHDAQFKDLFYMGGHMNAAGYLLTAKMIASYIDYIVRNNPDDFRQIGFVGTEHYNSDYKW